MDRKYGWQKKSDYLGALSDNEESAQVAQAIFEENESAF